MKELLVAYSLVTLALLALISVSYILHKRDEDDIEFVETMEEKYVQVLISLLLWPLAFTYAALKNKRG